MILNNSNCIQKPNEKNRTPTILYLQLLFLKTMVFKRILHVSPETSLTCMCVSVFTMVKTLLYIVVTVFSYGIC